MSKLTPLGQSMAALFTPEGERLRSAQKEEGKGGAPSSGPAARVAGKQAQISSHKPGDSLGNPNSPGYEPWGKKPSKEGAAEAPGAGAPEGTGAVVQPPTQNSQQFVRLSNGWEKLLLAQKKICEKAKGLFTLLEGPVKYGSQKRSKTLEMKSRGCIVDVDIQSVAEAEAAKAEQEKKKTA